MLRLPTLLRINSLNIASALALFCLSTTGCSNGPDTKLKLPMGWFDSPGDHAYLKGVVVLNGWALSEEGIDKVMVYVDRAFVENAKFVGPRPDVIKVYPEFAGNNEAEWAASLDTAAIPVGIHRVMVRAVSKKGAIRDLGTISVTIAR